MEIFAFLHKLNDVTCQFNEMKAERAAIVDRS